MAKDGGSNEEKMPDGLLWVSVSRLQRKATVPGNGQERNWEKGWGEGKCK
jgi:hypothetical protein